MPGVNFLVTIRAQLEHAQHQMSSSRNIDNKVIFHSKGSYWRMQWLTKYKVESNVESVWAYLFESAVHSPDFFIFKQFWEGSPSANACLQGALHLQYKVEQELTYTIA